VAAGCSLSRTRGTGGGGYAAGMITGGDIRDGTVASPDVKDESLKLKDLAHDSADNLAPRVVISRKGPGSYLPDSGEDTVFHTMSVPRGGGWSASPPPPSRRPSETPRLPSAA
jgi:hypothetical protein